MLSRIGGTRTLIGICGIAALVALVSAGVVVAQVQNPAPAQGQQGMPGMQGMGPMGRGMGPMGRGMGPMGPGPGPMMRGRGPLAMGQLLWQLGLTTEQVQAIKKIRESHRSDLQAIAGEAEPLREALRAAIDAGNELAIRDASTKLGALMTERAVLQSRIHAEVFGVLTPEQKEKANQLRDRAEQRTNRMRAARGKQAFLQS